MKQQTGVSVPQSQVLNIQADHLNPSTANISRVHRGPEAQVCFSVVKNDAILPRKILLKNSLMQKFSSGEKSSFYLCIYSQMIVCEREREREKKKCLF